MSKMCFTSSTLHLCSFHAMAVVWEVINTLLAYRFKKTWPSARAVKFAIAFKQWITASGTIISSWFIMFIIFPRKWPFGTLFPGYKINIFRQHIFPLSITNINRLIISLGAVSYTHLTLPTIY